MLSMYLKYGSVSIIIQDHCQHACPKHTPLRWIVINRQTDSVVFIQVCYSTCYSCRLLVQYSRKENQIAITSIGLGLDLQIKGERDGLINLVTVK
jgi:hypothetical protein